MKKVEIYTSDYCGFCLKAKALLEKENVEFTEINIGRDMDMRMKLQEKSHIRTVPQIFVDDAFVGGCDDIYALHTKGVFDSVFK